MDHEVPEIEVAKTRMRRLLTAGRRARTDVDRAGSAAANARHLAAELDGVPVVCAYLPLPSEPLTTALLDQLVAAGTAVLVPVVAADAPLDWCRYPAPTTPGAFGIEEPVGERLGQASVRSAGAILVPALGVDRTGARLGRGGGHYDRTLALLEAPVPALIAVLYDGELVDRVPVSSYDVAVNAAVTPTGGVERFPR